MKIHRILTILPIILLLTQCSDPKVPKANLLTDDYVKSIGFTSKSSKLVEQEKWHLEKFGEAKIQTQYVKSVTPMKGSTDMFPRFDVVRETYANSGMANDRFQRISESDPSRYDKSIQKGLVIDNSVWIVVADAHIFGYTELDSFLTKLQSELSR